MQPYPKIRHLAVLAARDAGKSTREVAEKYGVSESWVRRVVQQRREWAKRGPYKYRRRNRHGGTLRQRIMHIVLEDPRITVEELERVFQMKLSLEHIRAVVDMLDINHGLVWYGGLEAELFRSPTGRVTFELTRFLPRLEN